MANMLVTQLKLLGVNCTCEVKKPWHIWNLQLQLFGGYHYLRFDALPPAPTDRNPPPLVSQQYSTSTFTICKRTSSWFRYF